jgi:glycosyltransferase involved in cell wall biosynthesis
MIDSNIASFDVDMHGTYDLISAFNLRKIILGNNIDIIHGHLTRGAFYANLSARLSGRPCVVTAHSTSAYKHFAKANRIIAVSEAVRKSLLKRNLPSEKISVVYNSVSENNDNACNTREVTRRNLVINKSDVALCMVARFIEDKGHDLMIEALKELNDTNVRLFLVGKAQGQWYKTVSDIVQKYRLGDRVIFLGHRDDVSDILKAMDIFIAPSRREALGISILEALSSGLPVIAAHVGGIPEIIEHGINGLLFPVGDKKALSVCIKKTIDDTLLAKSISKNAKKIFKKTFSIDVMVERTINIYREVLSVKEN